MSGRPSFQFYPKDWRTDANLRRCTPAARGVWLDVMCVLHDSDDYGLVRYPLKELASAASASIAHLRELVDKKVLRGIENGDCEPAIYVPKHGRREGPAVTLVPAQPGPVWYSKRMVKDEYVRTIRGEGTRFGDAPMVDDEAAPKPTFGDGPSSSSSSSTPVSNTKEVSPLSPAAASPAAGQLPGVDPKPEDTGLPDCPHALLVALYAKHLPQLVQPRVWDGARAESMRARWRQCARPSAFGKGYRTVDEGVTFWERFFRYAATCPALRDGIAGNGNHRWFADLPWLMKAENFAKVIEGKYSE